MSLLLIVLPAAEADLAEGSIRGLFPSWSLAGLVLISVARHRFCHATSLDLDRFKTVALLRGKTEGDLTSDLDRHLRMGEFAHFFLRAGCRFAERLPSPWAAEESSSISRPEWCRAIPAGQMRWLAGIDVRVYVHVFR
jgi:hypothetical protein